MKNIGQFININSFAFSIAILLLLTHNTKAAEPGGHDSRFKIWGTNTVNKKKPGIQSINSQDWIFVENKGQLVDPNGSSENRKPISDIDYYVHNGNTNVYCRPGRISFVFIKEVETNPNVKNAANISEATGFASRSISQIGRMDQGKEKNPVKKTEVSRMDLVFIGGNRDALAKATCQQAYYENYYTSGDANHGIRDVHSYKKLTYIDIYPNIDLILTTGKRLSIEYAFLIHPGGNVHDIKMQWTGQDATNCANGNTVTNNHETMFRYGCALADIEETVPHSFVSGREIKTQFTREGSIHGFKIDTYDKSKDLLIDPTLWASYYGGSNSDQANGVTTDGTGNVYITGATSSNSGIATAGAYQSTTIMGGPGTTFLAKFGPNGALLWGTYYGGSSSDYAYAVASDGSGNIYMAGQTYSSSGIATAGAYQTAYGGGGVNEAFLAQLSSAGYLNWGTYYGGSGGDAGLALHADNGGNVFMTGETGSSTGIATAGAYMTSFGGSANTFLAKFTNAGVLSWATYYGGTSGDFAQGITTDGSGNAYITGVTFDNSGIATAGAYQTTNGGLTNGGSFLACFTASGALSWGTYYGGSGGDLAYGVNLDGSGNLDIIGQTFSTTGIATTGAYLTSVSTLGNAFLAQFTTSGALSWGTYYGGSGGDQANGVCTDGSGNIYITGFTSSSSGIATAGTYQTTYGGSQDAFLAKFSKAGVMLWGTYFGGSDVDNGIGTSTDPSGNVYITGYTSSSSALATGGSYQTSYGGSQDAFLAKFNSAGALPVTLTHFGAAYENLLVNLNWQTASEINNYYFGIERSIDGATWQQIGQVPGHGNSQFMESYTFTDNLQGVIPKGVFYYRLKQVDFNMKFEYSDIRAVPIESYAASLSVYPNPAGNVLNLIWTNTDNGNVILKLINTRGETIYMQNVSGQGLKSNQIDLSNFASGTFFLQIISGKEIVSKVLLKE